MCSNREDFPEMEDVVALSERRSLTEEEKRQYKDASKDMSWLLDAPVKGFDFIEQRSIVGARTDYSQEYRNKLDAIFSVSEEQMGLDHISRDKKPLIDSVKSAITAASQSTSQDRYELIKRLKIDIVHSEMTYYAEDGTPYISPVCVSCNGTLYNGRRSLDDAIDDIISDLTTIGGSLC